MLEAMQLVLVGLVEKKAHMINHIYTNPNLLENFLTHNDFLMHHFLKFQKCFWKSDIHFWDVPKIDKKSIFSKIYFWDTPEAAFSVC